MNNARYSTYIELKTYEPEAAFKLLEETVTLPLFGELTGVKPSELHAVKPPKKSKRYKSGGTKYNRYQYLKNLVRNLFDYRGSVHVLLGDHHYTEKQKTGAPPYYTRRIARWVLDQLRESGNAEVIIGAFNTHGEGNKATEVIACGKLLARLNLVKWMYDNALSFNDGEQDTEIFERVPEELRAYLPQSFVTSDTLKLSTKRELPDGEKIRLQIACPRTPNLNEFVGWMSDLEKSFVERGVTFSYKRASDGEIMEPAFALTSSIPERVYNLADKAGTYRFYHRFLTISKLTERPTLQIGGMPTAEIDLSAAHLSVAYAVITSQKYDSTRDYYKATLDHLGKPMTDGGRFVCKLMTNTALNCANPTQTVRAFHSAIRKAVVREEKRKAAGQPYSELVLNLKSHADGLLGWKRNGDGEVLSKEMETRDFLEAITESHADVSLVFASDYGVRAMCVESAIMRHCIDTLWNRPPDYAKCPVLPIHDGALVPAYMQPTAETVLADSFTEVVQRFNPDDLFSD